MSNEVSSFRESRNKLNMSDLFQHCCQNGNNAEATFDFVERTKVYAKLVRHCCRLATKSMLLRQSRTLLRHCCWCGRGFRLKFENCFVELRAVLSLCQGHARHQRHQLLHVDLRRCRCVCDYWIHGCRVRCTGQLRYQFRSVAMMITEMLTVVFFAKEFCRKIDTQLTYLGGCGVKFRQL